METARRVLVKIKDTSPTNWLKEKKSGLNFVAILLIVGGIFILLVDTTISLVLVLFGLLTLFLPTVINRLRKRTTSGESG